MGINYVHNLWHTELENPVLVNQLRVSLNFMKLVFCGVNMVFKSFIGCTHQKDFNKSLLQFLCSWRCEWTTETLDLFCHLCDLNRIIYLYTCVLGSLLFMESYIILGGIEFLVWPTVHFTEKNRIILKIKCSWQKMKTLHTQITTKFSPCSIVCW